MLAFRMRLAFGLKRRAGGAGQEDGDGAAMLAWNLCLFLRPTAVSSGRGAFSHTMPHR